MVDNVKKGTSVIKGGWRPTRSRSLRFAARTEGPHGCVVHGGRGHRNHKGNPFECMVHGSWFMVMVHNPFGSQFTLLRVIVTYNWPGTGAPYLLAPRGVGQGAFNGMPVAVRPVSCATPHPRHTWAWS